MEKVVKVPVFVKMCAGQVGTEQCEVYVVEVASSNVFDATLHDKVDSLLPLNEILAEHAESYGVYFDEDFDAWINQSEVSELDEGEEPSTYEPSIWVESIYIPSEHDMHKMGGGSFLDENEVKEAYLEYCDFIGCTPEERQE